MIATGWQSIPFCLSALRRIEPMRILDVGGAHHWAALADQFLTDAKRRPRVEAIMSGPVPPRARGLYDHVRRGELERTLHAMNERWDVVMFGPDLLRQRLGVGKALVEHAANLGRYVVVDIPLGLAHERKAAERPGQTVWTLLDFSGFPVVRRLLYRDESGRLCACAIISHADPVNLRRGFPGDGHDDAPDRGPDELERVLDRIADQAHELRFIKGYSTYRLGRRLVRHPAWNALRWVRNRNRAIVLLEATGEKNPDSSGAEVHLLHAAPSTEARGVPWDFAEHNGSWTQRRDPDGHAFLTSDHGRVRLPIGLNPELRFRKHPAGGKARVAFNGRSFEIDLYAPREQIVSVLPALEKPIVAPMKQARPGTNRFALRGDPGLRRDLVGGGHFNVVQQSFVDSMRAAEATACAVHTPRWMGITASTRELFDHCYPVPNTGDQEPYVFDEQVLNHHANVLIEAGARHIVFSGGDRAHFRLMEILHRRDPTLRFDMLWHGSYVQFLEDYNWEMIRLWIDAARAGVVHTVGTVKAGMEEFLATCGIRSRLVLNLVPGEVMRPPNIEGDETHVGMWISFGSYRKIAHAMLSAVAMTPNARLHAAGLEPRALEVIDYFGIETGEVHELPLPHDELLNAIRRTHATLYVTFSECCPMVPLESLQLGVPCLTGPNSHLFEDDEYLHGRLVVPCPDRADTIAHHLARAVEEREEIVNRYRAYIPGYNERARQSVTDFLADD